MDQPYEIEAKLAIPDASAHAALGALRALGAYRLEPAGEPERQRNTYFDTADMRLASQGCGLRLRDLGGRRIVTFKGAAVIRGGVHERGEWEQELGGGEMAGVEHDLANWPAGEARSRALAIAGDAPIQPIVLVETLRHNRRALRDGRAAALLSLDEGVIAAGDQTLPFRELEIELLPDGTRADLDELIALLHARFPLAQENRSKLARGLELLERSR
jgi:inorganic triphosphatase YgiF